MNSQEKSRIETQHQYFLKAEAIMKYLLGTSEKIEALVLFPQAARIVTTDYELYQALGSLKNYDNITRARLVKLLETADIASFSSQGGVKKILTHERVEELRNLAFKKQGDDKNE